MIKLHFSFLLNSYNVLLGKIRLILWNFDSLSTSKCKDYLLLLEQSQNEIKLPEFLSKNLLKLLDMAMECSWYE